MILQMPCGCVCAYEDLVGRAAAHHHLIIECRWCDATFVIEELAEWLNEAAPNSLQVGPAPLPLALVEHRVVEVVGRCGGCGAPEVRAIGTRDAPLHLVGRAQRLWD